MWYWLIITKGGRMQKGDFVLYISKGTICVGRVSEKWADKRWAIQPITHTNQIKRHEKFLMPVSRLKKFLDITKKI